MGWASTATRCPALRALQDALGQVQRAQRLAHRGRCAVALSGRERFVAGEQLGVADDRLERAAHVVGAVGEAVFERKDALVQALHPVQQVDALEHGAQPAEEDLRLARHHHVVRAVGEVFAARRADDQELPGARAKRRRVLRVLDDEDLGVGLAVVHLRGNAAASEARAELPRLGRRSGNPHAYGVSHRHRRRVSPAGPAPRPRIVF
jgi:hypothetical protein